jgi:uncharacterized membrane protein
MDSVATFHRRDAGDATPEGGDGDGARLSRGLGWASIGLGLAKLVVPTTLARAIGIDPDGRTSTVMRAMGLRELGAGLGILAQPRRPVPMWSRLIGDVIDLAALGIAAGTKRQNTHRVVGALALLAGCTALDYYASRKVTRAHEEAMGPVVFSVTINRPPDEVYAFWRKLENLPLFMDWLEEVRENGTTSRWIAKGPIGRRTVEWDAIITEDRPGELIAWKSTESSRFKTRGEVSFAKRPGGTGTEVRVEMELALPFTEPHALLAKVFANPQIKGDLRRFKQVMETGEVLVSDASVHRKPHPAQPAEEVPSYKQAPDSIRIAATTATPLVTSGTGKGLVS